MDSESPHDGAIKRHAEAGGLWQLQGKSRGQKHQYSLTRGVERPVGVVLLRCQGSFRDAQSRYLAVRSDRGAYAAVYGER
jgi:hypothetical protein